MEREFRLSVIGPSGVGTGFGSGLGSGRLFGGAMQRASAQVPMTGGLAGGFTCAQIDAVDFTAPVLWHLRGRMRAVLRGWLLGPDGQGNAQSCNERSAKAQSLKDLA